MKNEECVNIKYEYGVYTIEAGFLIFTSTSWKPMVPRGLKVDYRRSSEFYISASDPLDGSERTIWYVYVPLCK